MNGDKLLCVGKIFPANYLDLEGKRKEGNKENSQLSFGVINRNREDKRK